MTATPIAADDVFVADQGQLTTTISGSLAADNGSGADTDPDGGALGFAGLGFSPYGDGEDYLGAWFSNGQLGFLYLQHSGYVTFPVWSTTLVLTTAEGGRVILSTSGSFTYTAPAGFSGVDWFEYTLVDEEGETDIGRVTFTVNDTESGNDRPIAMADHLTAIEDQVVSGNVLADNGNGADRDPNGDMLSVKAQTIYTAKGGIVTIYANGDFVYTPRANFFGEDSFSYTLNDTHGASHTATVTLAVGAVNDAPTARDDAFTVVHDRSFNGNVLADNGAGADSDPEGGALRVIPQTLLTAHGGQVTLLANGNFTYVPAAGFLGADSFIYMVADMAGQESPATVSLNVVNRAPVAATDWFSAAFGKGISGGVLGNDSDPDGDGFAIVAGTFTTSRGGSVTIAADGSFVFTPAEAFYGTDSFTYRIIDTAGGSAIGTVMISTAAPAGSVFGNADDNGLSGTISGDTIFGLDGDDTMSGLGGGDCLAGGNDKDLIYGGTGGDKLYGQAGKDVLRGEGGNDMLSGGLDGDDLSGAAGDDRLNGGAGIDSYSGGSGNDRFLFAKATGLDYDRVQDFAPGDLLCVAAADYGLAAGSLADASYFALAGAANVDHGRFVYFAQDRSLRWDADGSRATADIIIALFNKQVSLSAGDFLVL